MRNFIILFIICLCTSCTDREVQLPHTTNNDITEIIDVSPIYMFYDETKPDSVDFNRRNMISTTNWLVNIDKRLTLKQVLPHLQYLYKKRHGDGMHTNESARNYFTCFNPETKSLSFIEFTDVIYNEKVNQNSLLTTTPIKDQTLLLKIEDNESISFFKLLESTITDGGSYSLSEDNLNAKFREILKDYSQLMIMIDQNTSFQNYILTKTLLLDIDNIDISILNEEFIFN